MTVISPIFTHGFIDLFWNIKLEKTEKIRNFIRVTIYDMNRA